MSICEHGSTRRQSLAGRAMVDLARDARHGLRALRRTPVFTAIAILTLALGIGANTAIFSIVNGVLLRPLAYPNHAQLMYLSATGTGAPQLEASVPEYLEFQRFNTSFSHVGAFRTGETNLTAGDRAVRIRSAVVDAALMQALGVPPIQGRLFAPEETGIAAPVPVAVISHGLWRSVFGGQPAVGQRVDLGGRRAEIVGVLPEGVDLMDTHADIWLPLNFLPGELRARNNHNLRLIGRLKHGVTEESAHSELRTLAQTWAERANVPEGASGHAGHVFRPATGGEGHVLKMTPLAEQILGRARRSLWVLQAAVALVLLIACANVANLLLARAESRQREFAVLTALGAGRSRILRKALTESLLLALAGCALGVVIARAGLQALIRAYPDSLPRIAEVTIDTRVLLVSLAGAVMCGLVFGLAPLLHTRASATASALRSGGRGSSGATRHHLRRGLVVAEIALTVIVGVGAGLLMRTVHKLTAVDAGFQRERLLTFSISLPLESNNIRTALIGVPSAERTRTFQRIVDRLRSVPGVTGASAMTLLPLDRAFSGNNTEIFGASSTVGIDYQRVMSSFFETMGIPIVQGRAFEPADAASPGWVTIVNETLANSEWKGQNPIGQRLRPASGQGPWFTVIGVAKDVKQAGLDRQVGPEAYVFVDQFVTDAPATWVAFSPATMQMVVRSTLPLATVAPTIRAAIRDIDPTVPVARLREMDDVVARSIERPRLLAQLLATFAGLALVLAAIGTYGVLAFMVSERRREMGIRLALGATRQRVLGLVLKQGLMLAASGIMVGFLAAILLTRLLTTLLFEVQPADPMTLAIVVPSILAIAGVACWLPAWRASRLDPNVVLRTE